MRVLLDTHALLWALLEPRKLSARAADVITDPSTTVLVSAASAWEVAIKHRAGRLDGAEEVVAAYADHLRTLRATELVVSSAHALRAGALDWDHRDPFDRMLAAQAVAETAELVTRDAAFGDLAGVEALVGLRLLW